MMQVFEWIRVLIILLVFLSSTILFAVPFFVFVVIKLLMPVKVLSEVIFSVVSWIVSFWISFNARIVLFFVPTKLDVSLPAELSLKQSYLLICNHRSWLDVMALLFVLNKRTSMIRFFIKEGLVWLPVVGQAMLALDFPMVKRGGGGGGRNIELAERSLAKLKGLRTTIAVFPEGTRFTYAKRMEKNSPFEHLLFPKSGGFFMAAESFSGCGRKVLDATVFIQDDMNLLNFFKGRCSQLLIEIEEYDLDREFLRNGVIDRRLVESWLDLRWKEKDIKLKRSLRGSD